MHKSGTETRVGTANRLAACLAGPGRDAVVADVRIGLGYTAVALEDGRTGVAYTFRDQASGGCCAFHGLRPLAPRPAVDLLELLPSSDVLQAGVGLACANALANGGQVSWLEGDVLEYLDVRHDDEVAMIGNFGPLLETLRRRARSLTVFERTAEPKANLRPEQEAPDFLVHCQVALITATSLINQTLDGLLEAARNCREVAILGASTPLVPQVFEGTPVTMLSGVLVNEPREVLRVVSEGGGMRQFSPFVRKVTWRTNAALQGQTR